MKLLRSLRREFTLLSRSFYFYVEIAVAVIFLAALLVVIPENFDSRVTEYTFINFPADQVAIVEKALFDAAGDYTVENVTLKSRGKEIPARLYISDMKYVYAVDSREDLIALAEDTGKAASVINDPILGPQYEYYLQGYETQRYIKFIELASSGDMSALTDEANSQKVVALEEDPRTLSDRQSVLPLMLTLNCVLMGILVTVGYVVEDKKTKVIKALRVQPVSMGVYLLSKMSVIIITALITCLIITVPIMKWSANYPLLILTVICGGFFTVSIGALMASFFDDMGKAFGSVYLILIILMIPLIFSLMPTVDIGWLRYIPSYFVVRSIKEALLDRDKSYVLLTCAGYVAGGLILLPLSARRYKAAGIGG